LVEAGIRGTVDSRSEKTGKKVAEGQVARIPYLLVIGDRDIAAGNVSVRHRELGDLGGRSVDQFMDDLLHEVRERLLVPIPPVKED
jgi:threonyl-tRNA synthetase